MSDPDAPPLDVGALVAALERNQVAFVAVGGMAAQWQGAARPTKDMDICPAWERENLDRLASALRELGAMLKASDTPSGVMAVDIDGALLWRMEIGTWRTIAGDIDVLLGIPRDSRWDLARYDHLRENAVQIEFNETTVLVASLKDIMRSKEIANRTPDQEALHELRRLEKARERKAREREQDLGLDYSL